LTHVGQAIERTRPQSGPRFFDCRVVKRRYDAMGKANQIADGLSGRALVEADFFFR
jgi:hypothetical protein